MTKSTVKPITVLLCLLSFGAGWDDYANRAIATPESQQQEYQERLIVNLSTGQGIPFNELMASADEEATPQAHSLAVYLISIGGRKRFLDCLREARMTRLSNRWTRTFQKHYGFTNLSALQVAWNQWVIANQQQYMTICADGT